MARLMLVSACLLATVIVAGAMPSANAATVPSLDKVSGMGPACAKSGDDSGTGGTHVSCRYACSKGNLLAIGVRGVDKDAWTYGDTSCGGAMAHCGEAAPICKGVSEGLTETDQTGAKCSGSTDEFWDSPMTVACASQGTNPLDAVCMLIENLCQAEPGLPGGAGTLLDRLPSPGGIPPVPPMRDLCIRQNPKVADLVDSLLATLLALTDGYGESFVVYDGGLGTALSYDASKEICTSQQL